MKNLKNQIDRLVFKILNEEIDKQSNDISDKIEGEWIEIDTNEELHSDVDESETEEGNEFTGALAKAREDGDNDLSPPPRPLPLLFAVDRREQEK